MSIDSLSIISLASSISLTLKVLGIERGNAKPRKDIAKWSDVKENMSYMYDDKFNVTEFYLKKEDIIYGYYKTMTEAYYYKKKLMENNWDISCLFKTKTEIIDKQINDMKNKILENETAEQLDFTVDDILLKRDMDFINKVKYPISYYAFNDCWDLLDREIKADIVMRFIDNIELESKGNRYSVKQVDFRSTMYEDFKKLYELGYIDTKRKMTCEKDGVSIDTFIRYSEYLPAKQVMQNLYRLNQCYEVDLYKGTFYKDTCKLDFSPFFKKGDVPIRVFPLQKDTGKDLLSMGMLVTKENTLDVKVDNLRDLFECIPQEVTEDDF